MNPKQEFWTCVIGPADRNQLPNGADFPMRVAVADAFQQLTGEHPEICFSGWGNDSQKAAEASVKESFVYAVEKTNSPEPKLRPMKAMELIDLVTNFAKEYHKTALETVAKNGHLNGILKEGEVTQPVVNAVITDFLNFVAYKYWVDYAFSHRDLNDPPKKLDF